MRDGVREVDLVHVACSSGSWRDLAVLFPRCGHIMYDGCSTWGVGAEGGGQLGTTCPAEAVAGMPWLSSMYLSHPDCSPTCLSLALAAAANCAGRRCGLDVTWQPFTSVATIGALMGMLAEAEELQAGFPALWVAQGGGAHEVRLKVCRGNVDDFVDGYLLESDGE